MASTKFLSNLVIDGANGTVLDVQGSVGQLFSVTDSLTGDLFAVSDISGIPILNVNSSGAVDIDGTLSLGDSDKIQLGASQDLQIYHDGSNSYIQNGTGSLVIEQASGAIALRPKTGETGVLVVENGAVSLYYDDVKKFETTSTGVTITGNISAITASGHDFMLGNSNNTSTADTSGFRMHQSATYDDGRYAHRFRKYDHGGGIPLYIDGSGSTANIFTALARFGTYTGETKTFEVFGTMGATNFSGSSSGTNTGDQDLSGLISSITVGTGLDGTTASGDATISLDLSELTDMTANITTTVDELILLDDGAERRKRFSEIFGSAAYSNTSAFAAAVHNHSGTYTLEYELMQSDSSDRDMHVWRKNHAMLSDDSGVSTYIIVQTNVPQDNYSMGGFTLVYQDAYNSSGEGGEIKIYGYWNPESNGGFEGFRYECSNPYHTPTIEVCRNSSSGKTAFFISGEGGSYTQLLAKDLWLGYSAASATSQWGDGWTVTQASAKD